MTTKTKSPKVAAQTSRSAPASGSKPKPAAAESPASARLRRDARAAVAANLAELERSGSGVAPVNDHNEQTDHKPAEQRPEVGEKKSSAGGGKPAEPSPQPVKPKGKKAEKPAMPAKAPKPPKVKRLSCIDAAAQIIGKDPVGCADLIAEMGQRKLWTSPNGKTPSASLYAAIIREIAAKGAAARFKKIDRGLFIANSAAKKGA